MQAVKKYSHEEDFGFLTSGNQMLEKYLDTRNKAVALAKEILTKIDELNSLFDVPCNIEGTKFADLASAFSRQHFYGNDNIKRLDEAVKFIDTKFWNETIERSSITSVMHSKMKENFRTSISEKPPTFDREHVYGTLQHYIENRWQIYVEGAVNLFRSLDSSYKTNDGIRFKEKIIIKNAISNMGYCMYGNSEAQIQDLERIFMVMEGKDPSRIPYNEWTARKILKLESSKEQKFNYFSVRTFINGNVHIKLNRKDLVEKLNALIADTFGATLGHRAGVRN